MTLSFLFMLVQIPANVGMIVTSPASVPAGRDRSPAAPGLYRSYCQRCHGKLDGTDTVKKRAKNLPDFMSTLWHASHTDLELRVSILNGKGSSMPNFSDRLSEAQAQELVLFIRGLNPERARSVQPRTDDFENRFLRLQQEFDRLNRQFKELSR
jgi:mono/diheme cytochrome c family protein